MSDDDRKTFGFLVDVTLTELEIKAQLERNADIDRKMIEIKGEKAAANSGFNEDLKTLRKEQETLLSSINTGKTKSEIQCYHDKDERRGIMLTRRADNGFIVDERALTADELNEDRQGSLFEGVAPADRVAPPDGEDEEQPHDADLDKTLAEYQASQTANAGGEEHEPPADEAHDGDEDEDDSDDDSDDAGVHAH